MTCNNYTEDDILRIDSLCRDAVYGIYGKEVGPKGTPHLQCYVYFKNPRSWSGLCKAMPRAWIQKAEGTAKQNEKYCGKDEDYVVRGKCPEQGKRTDLDQLIGEVLNGRTVDDIVVEIPVAFHQYGRTLERVEQIRLRKQWRTEMTKGIWYHGPSGVGKSHKVFTDYNPDTHYIKNLNEDWWDGYKGQPIVILNEFRGQIPFSELLDLVDKWPKTVKWRSREPVPFLAKVVLIASIRKPEEVYVRQEGEPWSQFERRFEVVDLSLEQK